MKALKRFEQPKYLLKISPNLVKLLIWQLSCKSSPNPHCVFKVFQNNLIKKSQLSYFNNSITANVLAVSLQSYVLLYLWIMRLFSSTEI